jgi:hypothetical protein
LNPAAFVCASVKIFTWNDRCGSRSAFVLYVHDTVGRADTVCPATPSPEMVTLVWMSTSAYSSKIRRNTPAPA